MYNRLRDLARGVMIDGLRILLVRKDAVASECHKHDDVCPWCRLGSIHRSNPFLFWRCRVEASGSGSDGSSLDAREGSERVYRSWSRIGTEERIEGQDKE